MGETAARNRKLFVLLSAVFLVVLVVVAVGLASSVPGRAGIIVSITLGASMIGGGGLYLVRRARRIVRREASENNHLCPACRFDLSGSPLDVLACPECGRVRTDIPYGLARPPRAKGFGTLIDREG